MKGFVLVVGNIWQPGVGLCAMRYDLSQYDIDNIGQFTRENVQDWLDKHAGDFQHIEDFYAVNARKCCVHDTAPIELPWENGESECVYSDCMNPEE